MRHAGDGARAAHPADPRGARRGARRRGWSTRDDADVLASGWRMVSRVRNAVTLVRGKPARPAARATPGSGRRSPAILGYPAGASDAMVNDQLRTMRARTRVVDRVFWG